MLHENSVKLTVYVPAGKFWNFAEKDFQQHCDDDKWTAFVVDNVVCYEWLAFCVFQVIYPDEGISFNSTVCLFIEGFNA